MQAAPPPVPSPPHDGMAMQAPADWPAEAAAVPGNAVAASNGPAAPAADLPTSPRQAFLDSLALFQGRRTVEIRHNGTVYRLQSTKAGKLILTK